MENSFEDQLRADQARKKVKEMKGFYKHLTVYITINAFLLILKVIKLEPDETFFEWGTFSTAAFWGIIVIIHWYSVFGADFVLGKNWEERKVKELMDKQKSNR